MLARNQDPGLPANGLYYVPVRVIDKNNVKNFRLTVEKLLSEGK